MSKEWYLRSEKEIKIFSHLSEEVIAVRSPGQKENEAEVLSREKARERWKELVNAGFTQIKTKDNENDEYESLKINSKSYWTENIQNNADPEDTEYQTGFFPGGTSRENNESSTFFDSDDYESVQDQGSEY